METLRSDTVHASDSIHSLSCINTHHIDEISKEKEDELLYGTGDDGDEGDEDDALSDDSMRLRLSDDDEPEPDDVLTSILDDQQSSSTHIGSGTLCIPYIPIISLFNVCKCILLSCLGYRSDVWRK